MLKCTYTSEKGIRWQGILSNNHVLLKAGVNKIEAAALDTYVGWGMTACKQGPIFF